MGALSRCAAAAVLLAGCMRAPADPPASRASIVRSFADEVPRKATVSLGRYRHAVASVQGLPIDGNTVYHFAVTVPSDARLRFRPVLHPAAAGCWHSGPALRVVFRQRHTDAELWSGSLQAPMLLRAKLWVHALVTRMAPAYAPRNLLPPEVVLGVPPGEGVLRFEAVGDRDPDCLSDAWHAQNGGHAIGTEAVWGMPVLQAREFSKDRPDVIIVVIDTLRADVLPMYGGPAATPHLSRFIEDAVVFTRAFTTFPMTREATFSLLTGMHPSQLGVPYWRWNLLPAERAVAAERATGGLAAEARRNGMRSVFAGNNGFIFDTAPVGYDGNWGEVRFFYKEPYDTQNVLHAFSRWSDDPQRMFAMVHFNQPHWPHALDPAFPAHAAGGFPAEYLSEVAAADEAFGEVLRILRKNKRFDDAIIIVAADHGEVFPEGEKAGHGTTLRFEEIHVPLIVRFPHGTYGGRAIEDTVSIADVLPTLREALGWPAKAAYGRSLMPLVRGEYGKLPKRILGWEGKGIDGYTDGVRFYFAHQPNYRPMAGILPGPVEAAYLWPPGAPAPAVTRPVDADREILGRLEDEWRANRVAAWRDIARAPGEPPLPPQAAYVVNSAALRVETVPAGALRPVSGPTGERRFVLVPPSAELRIESSELVRLGPWGLPYGGTAPRIRTDTERRMLIGKPREPAAAALWIDENVDDNSSLAPEVKDALKGWGYVK